MENSNFKFIINNILNECVDEEYNKGIIYYQKNNIFSTMIAFSKEIAFINSKFSSENIDYKINCKIEKNGNFSFECGCGYHKKNIGLCSHAIGALLDVKNKYEFNVERENNILDELIVKNEKYDEIEKFGIFEYNDQMILKPLIKAKNNKSYKFFNFNPNEFVKAKTINPYFLSIKKISYTKVFDNKNLYLLSFSSLYDLQEKILFEKKELFWDTEVNFVFKVIGNKSTYSIKGIFKDENGEVLYKKYFNSRNDMAILDNNGYFRIIKNIQEPINLKKFNKFELKIEKEKFIEKYYIPLSKIGIKFDFEDSDIDISYLNPQLKLYIFKLENKFKVKLKIEYSNKEHSLNEIETNLKKRSLDILKYNSVNLNENGETYWSADKFVDFIENTMKNLPKNIKVLYSKDIKIIKNPKILFNTIKQKEWFETDIIYKNNSITNMLNTSKNKKYIVLKDGSIIQIPEKIKKLSKKIKMDKKINALNLFEFQEECVGDGLEFIEKLKNFETIKDYTNELNLKYELRGYQKKGYNFLRFLKEYNLNGILADDMGLGKTFQTIALLSTVKQQNLIIVPNSVLHNWINEINKFSNMSYTLYSGKDKIIDNSDIIITTYGTVRNSLDLLEKTFEYIVLDEAQYIKNSYTKTAKSVKKLRAKHKLALTGTPIENSILDIYSIFDFLMPNYLGTKKEFIELLKTEKGTQSIKDKIKPFIIRRTKEEVLKELPTKVEETVYVDMTEDQKDVYFSMLNTIKNTVNTNNKILLFEALTRLRQISLHPKLVLKEYKGKSGKFEELKNFIYKIINSNHKIIIFSQFVKMLKLIEEYLNLEEISYEIITGKTKNRNEIVDKYNNNANTKIMLVSLKAGGTGLNITSADYVIHFDPWWNPAVENQATDRAHRIGQTKKVFVYKYISKGSVEEKILKLKKEKKDLYGEFVKSTDFSKKDLEFLFN
ncbi:DEAD/DEAH box helicase [Tepiditoga spiralis]|uniref:DEAD/DEAH box helicase n=1 Tax=Tepiditoga spiralis TaxID=2108365 RepID=A0A7G1G232_9BACT|nr:DEAD/DEAH box helicase [Tepiditoga spiralis]BBE30258.1 DEAD/DEAH box helicase [Tepiditoga spiralis]